MIPMAPIEGHPSAVQLICSLTPGYYQVQGLDKIYEGAWSKVPRKAGR